MRGIAAILVMLFHFYYESFSRFFKNDFLAVDFFFILSGFVIYHAYGEKLSGSLTKADFIARRIARLYPMMAIGLAVGVAALYGNTVQTPTDFTPRDMISSLLCNFAFLPYLTSKFQMVLGVRRELQLFPSDTPLWSILFELIASAAFVVLVRMREEILKRICLLSGVVLVLSAFFHGFSDHKRIFDMDAGWTSENVLGGFPRLMFGFSFGMLIYRWRFERMPNGLKKMNRNLSPWFLYLCLIVMLSFPFYIQGFYDLVAVGVIAPLLVWFGSLSIPRDTITTKISEFLGWISFPLYCLHAPVFQDMKFLNSVYPFSDHRLSVQGVSIIVSVGLAIVVGVVLDRLQIQRWLASALNAMFVRLSR